MDDLALIIDKYADDVLRACVHYLGNMADAESAFEDVFLEANRQGLLSRSTDIFPDLLYITRKVCIADTIRDDNEEKFLQNFFGITKSEAEYVMGYKQKLAINY